MVETTTAGEQWCGSCHRMRPFADWTPSYIGRKGAFCRACNALAQQRFRARKRMAQGPAEVPKHSGRRLKETRDHLLTLITRIPPDARWTADERARWLALFLATLDYHFPARAEATAIEETDHA